MSEHSVGIQRPLTFSNKWISAVLVESSLSYAVPGRCIVLNLGQNPILLSGSPAQSIPPLQSTILIGGELHQVERMLVVAIADDLPQEGLVDELRWELYANLIEEPSDELRATSLFRSNQDCIGSRRAHEAALGVASTGLEPIRSFDVKVNFWFAPAGTNCVIHRYHPFVEIHLQILGSGRMQKFRTPLIEDMYEEILMSPGFTQPFFNCVRDDANGFAYPWHQYYAETDCIWMAIEFHPLADALETVA